MLSERLILIRCVRNLYRLPLVVYDFLTECSIVDGNIQQVEDSKPSNVTGYFYYPISCSGTLVSINAHGFCPKTNKTVVLVLFIVNEQDYRYLEYQLEAECDTSTDTVTSLDGSEYYKGNITTGNRTTTKVSSGEYLAIKFKYTLAGRKHFQPAIVNKSSKHALYFTEIISPGEQQANISLLFSATISSGKTKIVQNE